MPGLRDTSGRVFGSCRSRNRHCGDAGKPTPASPGFSLVEIMVSMSVLLILVILLSQALAHTSGLWLQGEANKERMQNERAICDFIATELRAALLPIDRTNTSSLQFVVNPPAVASGSYSNRDSIFWQAPLASDQTLGDVAEIGYFVKWTAVNKTNPQARLCRMFINPGSGSTPSPLFKIYSDPSNWVSSAIIDAAVPADKANNYQGLFAEDILGLWVRCLDNYGNQIVQDYAGTSLQLANGNYGFDSRRGYTDSKGAKSPGYTDATGNKKPLCALPPAVEVSLVLMDAKTALRIGSSEQSAIMAAASSLQAPDADSFVAGAQTNPMLQRIKSGLRPYQIKLNLQNSR